MNELSYNEMLQIEGGKLETASDWFLLCSAVSFCFCVPMVGVPATIIIAALG